MAATNQFGERTPYGTRSLRRVRGSSRATAVAERPKPTQPSREFDDPERAEAVCHGEEPGPEPEPPSDPVRPRVDARQRAGLVVRHPHGAVRCRQACRSVTGLDACDGLRRPAGDGGAGDREQRELRHRPDYTRDDARVPSALAEDLGDVLVAQLQLRRDDDRVDLVGAAEPDDRPVDGRVAERPGDGDRSG